MLVSITISFHPDLVLLRQQFDSLRGQVDRMLVIDNGSKNEVLESLRSLCQAFGCTLHALGHNTGIAHAQNVGIQAAQQVGAKMLLLLDQDSIATPGMVKTLSRALEQHPRAAAAGPSSVDQRTGSHSFFVRDGYFGPRRWKPINIEKSEPIHVGFLIASGTLIRASALENPEPMLASWFIDHVDTEWCLRIRSQGWTLLGVAQAQLQHQLGDKVSTIWLLRTRQVAHHSPLRDYYMFRNSILLVHKRYTPWRWKVYFLARLIQFSGFFLTFTPQRLTRFKMMAYGVLHGLQGRTGPWR
ncbi:glycosyltransferase family 2 protein [Rhodoferax sp.]|uniref:glycosyltransferase family 2 protein n=1 Tax=Rhodoferax sp. TaxID=50421 RepID=UPI00374DD425